MISNIKANAKKAILNEGPIDEIFILPNKTIEVKFNDNHKVISSNITPFYLGKCFYDYLKLQTEKPDKSQGNQVNIINQGLTEIQFEKYKNKIAEAFYNLFCLKLPDNYSNKYKD
jgi:hypothetical protein